MPLLVNLILFLNFLYYMIRYKKLALEWHPDKHPGDAGEGLTIYLTMQFTGNKHSIGCFLEDLSREPPPPLPGKPQPKGAATREAASAPTGRSRMGRGHVVHLRTEEPPEELRAKPARTEISGSCSTKSGARSDGELRRTSVAL